MKKLFVFLFAFPLFFISCDKNGEESNDLFKSPLVNWSLTKSQVKAKETHTLIEDTAGEDILLLFGPWDSHGDGSLKYSGDDFFSTITYGFYNDNKLLECVRCSFDLTNVVTEKQVVAFLQRKYNNEYAIRYPSEGGRTYVFKTSFGIVVLEIKSTAIITFTKSKHDWYYK